MLCLLAAMRGVWQQSALAAPTLEVRDRFEIRMDPIRRDHDKIVVSGEVVRASTGLGAAHRRVRVQVASHQVIALTDESGFFQRKLIAAGEGEHHLSVDVDATSFLDAAHFEIANFRIDKRSVSIALSGPTEIEDNEGSLVLGVRLSSSDGPISVPLVVDYFLVEADGSTKQLGELHTHEDRPTTLAIPVSLLGNATHKELRLVFAGNDDLDKAIATHKFVLRATSELTLNMATSQIGYEDSMALHGSLRSRSGAPIAKAIVAVERAGVAIAHSKTDALGAFSIRIRGKQLGAGPALLQATYTPTESWRERARSKPFRIEVATPKPPSLRLLVVVFFATCLALLSFGLLRWRPWKRWRESMRSKKTSQLFASVDNRDSPLQTGLSTSTTRLRSTLSKPQHVDIRGTVRDALKHSGIASAHIEIDEATFIEADMQGEFATKNLSAGRYPIRVQANGFMSETFTVNIPHRGELHRASVSLLPVREKIFELYKEALIPHLPEARLWGILTPRQILDSVRSTRQEASLAALTNFVEECFFSQRIQNEEIVLRARSLIAAFESSIAQEKRHTQSPRA